MSRTTVTLLVMGAPLIVWVGTFLYLLMIDRSLRKLESGQNREDDRL